MDVDGTLTDGKIYMGANGEVMKAFDIKDGYGIHDILIPAGIIPVIITGRTSKIVENRCLELGIKSVYQGVHDKLCKLNEILAENKDTLSSLAYIGDDLNDMPVMVAIRDNDGIIGCPLNAIDSVRNICAFKSQFNGGEGAVREFIAYICNYEY